MRDLWGMQEDAVLDDPAHLVTRVGLTRRRRVKEVTVDGRHAACRGPTHSAGSLPAPVDGVVGEVNLDRVRRPAEGEDVDCRQHPIVATVDCEDVEPTLAGRTGGAWGDPHGDTDQRDNCSDGDRYAQAVATADPSQISHSCPTPLGRRDLRIVDHLLTLGQHW